MEFKKFISKKYTRFTSKARIHNSKRDILYQHISLKLRYIPPLFSGVNFKPAETYVQST